MKKIFYEMKKNYIYGIMLLLVIVITILGILLYRKNGENTVEVENRYNLVLYELIEYMQNVETYLAKSLISSTPEHGADTLTHVWREANLAQAYLAQLPVSSHELSSTSKFLNQVSDYSYSLSRKNISGEGLSEEDLKNLKELHGYCRRVKQDIKSISYGYAERVE